MNDLGLFLIFIMLLISPESFGEVAAKVVDAYENAREADQ